jgi:hypothetical protein
MLVCPETNFEAKTEVGEVRHQEGSQLDVGVDRGFVSSDIWREEIKAKVNLRLPSIAAQNDIVQ